MPTRVRKPVPGRPRGVITFDAPMALAFGEVVRATRTRLGVSQEELAHRADLDRSGLSRIERGRTQPTLSVVFKIATSLGIKATTLVGKTEHCLNGRIEGGPFE